MAKIRRLESEPMYVTFGVPDNATVSTASVVILMENPTRATVSIFNLDTTRTLFLAFGANAAELNKGIPLVPRSGFLFDRGIGTIQAINGISTGAITVAIQEGT